MLTDLIGLWYIRLECFWFREGARKLSTAILFNSDLAPSRDRHRSIREGARELLGGPDWTTDLFGLTGVLSEVSVTVFRKAGNTRGNYADFVETVLVPSVLIRPAERSSVANMSITI